MNMETNNSKYTYTVQIGNINGEDSEESFQSGTFGGLKITLLDKETGKTREINIPKRALLAVTLPQNKDAYNKVMDIKFRLRVAEEQVDDEAILNCFKEYEEIFKDYVAIKS